MIAARKIRLVHITSNHHDHHSIPLATELSESSEFLLILSCFRHGNEKVLSSESKVVLKKSVRTLLLHRSARKRNPLQFIYDILMFLTIVDFAPNVVLIEGVDSPYFLAFYPLMKIFGIRLIFMMHDVMPHSGSEKPLVDMFTRLGVHLCDNIVVFSQFQKMEFQKRFSREASVVHLTHPILYEEYYQDHTIQRERWTILFFGQVRPNKGLDILIQAAEIARRQIPDLKVIVAGSCENFEAYEKFIVTSGIFELHLENVPNRDVGGYFLRSQCSVLPYLDATQSGALLVSLAFNCPVIAAEVGGLPEYLSVGENGVLFKRGNVSELAKTIVDLLLNEDRLRYMQNNARTKLIERFSPSAIAREVLAVIDGVQV